MNKTFKNDSVGPFTVIVDVFGPKMDAKTHSLPQDHIEPSARCQMTVVDNRLAKDGGSVQGALNSLRTFSYDAKGKKVYEPLPFYNIKKVIDHGKASS